MTLQNIGEIAKILIVEGGAEEYCICSLCRQEVDENQQYCTSCGAKLEKEGEIK